MTNEYQNLWGSRGFRDKLGQNRYVQDVNEDEHARACEDLVSFGGELFGFLRETNWLYALTNRTQTSPLLANTIFEFIHGACAQGFTVPNIENSSRRGMHYDMNYYDYFLNMDCVRDVSHAGTGYTCTARLSSQVKMWFMRLLDPISCTFSLSHDDGSLATSEKVKIALLPYLSSQDDYYMGMLLGVNQYYQVKKYGDRIMSEAYFPGGITGDTIVPSLLVTRAMWRLPGNFQSTTVQNEYEVYVMNSRTYERTFTQ